MALSKYFWEDLPAREDEELYQMLARPNDYEPEAILAVTEEVKRRNIPAEAASRFRTDAKLKANLIAEERQSRTKDSQSYSVVPLVAFFQFIFRRVFPVLFWWLKD